MENENEIKQPGMGKVAFQYGLLLALALILLSLVFYLAGDATNKWGGYLSYPIIVVFLVYGIIKFRNDINNGAISYGKALGLGTLISLFAGIIYAVYSFVFYQFIGPEVIDEILIKAEETIIMQNPNISTSELDMAMSFTRTFTNPIMLSIGSIISYTFIGFIFSLIIAIFLKKKPVEEL